MTATSTAIQATFVLGPPGSGKTTIALGAATQLSIPFHTIDDWVRTVYSPKPGSRGMTDRDVDRALSLLLDALDLGPALCEFAHHDYVGLAQNPRNSQFVYCSKVIVVAPLMTCLARNQLRSAPVPHVYVERAWRSTQELLDFCFYRSEEVGPTHVIDTSSGQVADAITAAVQFIGNQ